MLQILIIDDDKNIRRYLKTILLTAGYTPICTETADEALHIMETNTIALIILDIMLPGTDGFTFTKLLRDCKNDIPILMHTAKQLPDDIKTGFLAGADDYMTKPADEDVLLLRIKALLRRAKITAEHQLRIGHTILNYDALTVTTDKVPSCFLRKSFFYYISCFLTQTRYSPACSLWTISGDQILILAMRLSAYTSTVSGTGSRIVMIFPSQQSGGLDIKHRCKKHSCK